MSHGIDHGLYLAALIGATSFATFGLIVAWIGVHPAAAYTAAVLGYALYLALAMTITAHASETVKLQ